MKSISKLILMLLLASFSTHAQSNQVLKQQLLANENTELSIDLRNTFVQFETSPDANIYIDYSIDFKNYKTKDIKTILEGITTGVVKKDNTYVLKIDSEKRMSSKVYHLENSFGLSLDKAIPTAELTDRKFKKNKESLFKSMLWEESRAEVMLEMFKKFKVDGSTEAVDLDKLKTYNVKFIIKVPEEMVLSLKLDQSEVRFLYASKNKINCVAENSTIRSLGFSNLLSNFKMNNGSFKAHHITGGQFTFKNLNKIILGTLDNVVIDSEFSDFSIGEVGSNTVIGDFNSQFWLYSFSPKMGLFKLDTEYSKINIYYPEDISNFAIMTNGYSTIHYVDNKITEVQTTQNKEPKKMFVYGNDSASVLNKIAINSANGIIRLGKDFIDVIE